MITSYQAQTVKALNPLARFAHRSRLRKSLDLSLSKIPKGGKLLDYGCGAGAFIAELQAKIPGCAIGYEPYMKERSALNLPIYNKVEDFRQHGPFSLVTLFETIEHLSDAEIDTFLAMCEQILVKDGGILISGPVEIGPALIFKEFNRSVFRLKLPEHRPLEFVMASIFGVPARRADNIKSSHRGFDFRRAMRYLKTKGWDCTILCYGPLPIGTWYGNSQVYMWAEKTMM